MLEDLKLISNLKQVDVETNTEGSSVLGLQWTVVDDTLEVCRDVNNEFETPTIQKKFLSPVLSIIDPTGLFAPFNFHVRRLLKIIWKKSGQHWVNEVELVESAEFPKWKK